MPEPSKRARERANDHVYMRRCDLSDAGSDPCTLVVEDRDEWCVGCRASLVERNAIAQALDTARAEGAAEQAASTANHVRVAVDIEREACLKIVGEYDCISSIEMAILERSAAGEEGAGSPGQGDSRRSEGMRSGASALQSTRSGGIVMSAPVTPGELRERLSELHAKAAPGPWDNCGHSGVGWAGQVHLEPHEAWGDPCPDSVDLIVLLRNNVPAIVAALDVVQAALTQARFTQGPCGLKESIDRFDAAMGGEPEAVTP